MKTPSFSYMGGKVRLRKWLIEHFPKTGRVYLEPFAGLANVFYHARKDLQYEQWWLGDINARFFHALRTVNLDSLPESVDREAFHQLKASGCIVSSVLEPELTFAAKGYAGGFRKGSVSHRAYNGSLYKPRCENARALLKGVRVETQSWECWEYDQLGQGDFVYYDPPYYETKASYPNIDHRHLIGHLNEARHQWAVSGYDNALYENSLRFARKIIRERNSEIKQSNTGRKEPVIETLWMNY